MGSTDESAEAPRPMSVAERIRAARGADASSTDRTHGPTTAYTHRSAVERALGTSGTSTADRLAALKRDAASRRSELDADLDELRGGAEAVARGVPAEVVVAEDSRSGAPGADAAGRQGYMATASAPGAGPAAVEVPDAPEDYPMPPPPPAPGQYVAPSPYGPPGATMLPRSPAGGTMTAPAPSGGSGTAALVLAVVGIVFGASGFLGIVLGALSLRLAHGARKAARAAGRPVPGAVTGATVLALVAVVVGVLVTFGQIGGS